MMRTHVFLATILFVAMAISVAADERPNILLAISDDQSWQHTSIAGCRAVSTPAFDRVARSGVLFTQAFTASPSCTPSRAGILTGRNIWELEGGACLWGWLPKKFAVYPDLLEEAGYQVGFTGKGWSPGSWQETGRTRNPAGPEYNSIRLKDRPPGVSPVDYAANFEEFFRNKPKGKRFCFWYGGTEPHRGYTRGIGLESGKKLEDVDVPPFLPDAPEVRSDLLDYCVEIEWFDTHLGRMLEVLEKAGELENTLVVVTSDNGMPFPRSKAGLYDYGTRMPLAIAWPAGVPGSRVVTDHVSLTDLAPTFLEAAGLRPLEEMSGQSLLGLLLSGKSGRVEADRDRIVLGKERHAWVRKGNESYPVRAIRTDRFLYVRNLKPHLWPHGGPDDRYTFNRKPYADTDYGPTAEFVIDQREQSPEGRRFFDPCYEKRPAEELYDMTKDPDQIHNLAEKAEYAEIKKELRTQLDRYLNETGDPRMSDGGEVFENAPYYHRGKSIDAPPPGERFGVKAE